MEAIVVGSSNGPLTVWDMNGTNIQSYQDRILNAHSLCFIHNDYIIASDPKQALLKVWSVRSKEPFKTQAVAPGKISCLSVSPDGLFCITGIGNNIYLWNLPTMKHIAKLERHYQEVSVLSWSDEGSFIVSGGKDGLILVWMMSRITSSLTVDDKKVEPALIWSDHSLPITSIYIGKGGLRSRIFSCSIDLTCKVYDLSHQQLLMTFVFSCQPTHVTCDPGESLLFVGCSKGHIHPINLMLEHDELSNVSSSLEIPAHEKQVIGLRVTLDGATLISASTDCCVKLWDIHSKQCIKSIFVGKEISFLELTLSNKFNIRKDNKQLMPLHVRNKQFQEFVYISKKERLSEVSLSPVNYEITNKNVSVLYGVDTNCEHHEPALRKTDSSDHSLKVKELKRANKELYDLIINDVVKGL